MLSNSLSTLILILIVLTTIVATTQTTSDRRKLRARTAERFQLAPDVADNLVILVPDGLLSQKFSAYNDEPGVSGSYPEGG